MKSGDSPTLQHVYAHAMPFDAFLRTSSTNRELWTALARRATVPPDLVQEANAVPGCWHLLVLLEDWCGDAINIVPVISRLTQLVQHIDVRVLRRDEHPALMDAHLTNGRRAIPVIMVLDDKFHERAWWGPRPIDLQRWVTTDGQALSKTDRYREVRRWYALNRGRTTLAEIIGLLRSVSVARTAA